MDREAWRIVIHGVAKSRTWLSDWTELNWADDPVIIQVFIKWSFWQDCLPCFRVGEVTSRLLMWRDVWFGKDNSGRLSPVVLRLLLLKVVPSPSFCICVSMSYVMGKLSGLWLRPSIFQRTLSFPQLIHELSSSLSWKGVYKMSVRKNARYYGWYHIAHEIV